MPDDTTATSGQATESKTTQDSTTASGQKAQDTQTESVKTYTQEEVNRFLAKELKPFKEIKAELEKLQTQKKEKEDAEKSELEKMQEQLLTLSPFKEKYESLEKYVKTELEAILSEMSDEDKETIENLSVPITGKIALAKRLSKSEAKPNGAAREGARQTETVNTVEAKAKQFLLERGVKEDNPLYQHQLKLTMAQMSQ